ncbi:Kinesin-like protein KIN-7I [Gracilariopsis chorda]|uniref:Kinesin-like protein KIN-7I n=1 Tax=Gracilariopsis chorda TaxID=448386 RepID=A0A2V3J5T2_9FLOR|nr:Kinesin-like protein KIN-7I [Gracilariopsis chorda]|eukprot:PXF49781.1 Kinesin-like protein KIN-7I [Gracilariopsis chorda]
MSDGDLRPPSPSSERDDTVRVAVRVRPINAREQAVALNPSAPSWQISTSAITQCVNNKPVHANRFSFDHIFQPGVSNHNVFDSIAKQVVTSAVDGINGVIFAYGQTAAGKTYTMLGTDSDPGVTRRSISHVFSLIASLSKRQFLLRASYIEIYNELIRDLLAPSNDNLRIHEDAINKRVFVDAREEVVTAVDDVMQIISKGETVRAVGETNMNDRSSRSHTIFTLKIESREMTCTDAEQDALNIQNDGLAIRASTLSLVDLAGSERASFTKAQGMRLVEGGHINKSLLTLGTVINKLSSGESRTSLHIPYRDSKLTRLLQPALGGNARTAIICAVTPASLHMDETLSTLKFASRAKKVTNHAQTNEFLDDRAKLRRAEKQIALMKNEMQKLQKLRSGHVLNVDIAKVQREHASDLNSRVQAFEHKFEQIMLQLAQTDKPVLRGSGMKHLRADIAAPISLVRALDLQLPPEHLSTAPGHADSETDTQMTQLRHKVLEAERDKKQAMVEIEYERRAMADEVQILIASSEQATKERLAAEKECDDALSTLARSQAASLVDEIVTQAMNTSTLTRQVKEGERKLSIMSAVTKENAQLKKERQSLQKEISEFRKREKRGIGPVMKEARQEYTKRVDVENKLKSVRKQLQKLKTERASMNKERSDMERKMKALTSENERHRSHTEKAQSRIERVVSEAKKEFQANLAEKEEELLSTKNDLATTKQREELLEKQVTVLMETNAKMSLDLGANANEREQLQEEKVQLQEELKDSQRQLQSSESQSTSLTEQLCKAHLEMEEKKAELEEALRARSETERTELAASQQAFTELEIRFIQGEKVIAELRDRIQADNDEMGALQDAIASLQSAESKHMQEIRHLKEALTTAEENQTNLKTEKEMIRKELASDIERLQISMKNAEEVQLSAVHGVQHVSGGSDNNMDLSNDPQTPPKTIRNPEAEHLMSEIPDSSLPSGVRIELEDLREENEKLYKRIDELMVNSDEAADLRVQVNKLTSAVGRLEEENDDLRKRIYRSLTESETRTKELLRLTNVMRVRDDTIHDLNGKLDELVRGEGIVASLRNRIAARDVQIEHLKRQVQVQNEALSENGVLEKYKDTQTLMKMEEANYTLRVDIERLQEKVRILEKERASMIAETFKLRKRIKSRDGERLEAAIKRKRIQSEEFLEETRRRKVLREVQANSTTESSGR